MAPLGGTSFYIGLYREIHLKCSLSKTIELISTKFGRKCHWGMEIKASVRRSKGWSLLGPRKRLQYGKFWVSEKYSSHKPMARMHWYWQVWSNLGTMRFKFMQIKILGS